MERRKKRSFLIVLRLLGLFIGGMAVAMFVALSTVNLETLRGSILNIMRDATGLPFEIDGDVSWKFSLRPQIELNDVRVHNADWAREKYGFEAKRVDVQLNLVSLLRSRPTIQNIKVHDAKIALEQNPNGKYSVALESSAVEKIEPQSPSIYPFPEINLGGVEIYNLHVNIDGEKYFITDFNIRYMLRNDKR